jgi:hypothetical protein
MAHVSFFNITQRRKKKECNHLPRREYCLSMSIMIFKTTCLHKLAMVTREYLHYITSSQIQAHHKANVRLHDFAPPPLQPLPPVVARATDCLVCRLLWQITDCSIHVPELCCQHDSPAQLSPPPNMRCMSVSCRITHACTAVLHKSIQVIRVSRRHAH